MGTALTTVHQSSTPCCSHCGQEGHIADQCFHNPKSPAYRKSFRSKKDRKQDRSSDELSDRAMVSKSILHGDLQLPESMKNSWMIDSALTSHICNDDSLFETIRKTV